MNEEEKSLKKELWVNFEQWSECSTSHGYPNIFRNKSRFIKAMWFILLVISTSFCGLLIVKTVTEYLEFEVVTKIRVLNEIPFEFPTITICSLTPLVSKEFIQLEKDFFSKATNKTFDSGVFLSLDEVSNLRRKFTTEVHPYFNESFKKSLFLNLKDMIIECNFEMDECNKSDFKNFYHETYGNCIEFNSNLPKKRVFNYGLWSGLYMELSLPNLDSSFLISNRFNGLRIFIQNLTYDSINTANAIDVKPGTMSSIQLKKVVIERKPYPYSDCMAISSFETFMKSFLEEKNSVYRQLDCIEFCWQNIIVKNCKCYSTWIKISDSTVDACLNQEETKCVYRQFSELNKNINPCLKKCPYDCLSINFDCFTSTSEFPTKSYFDYLKRHPIVMKQLKNENISNVTYDVVKERVVGFYIYFNKLIYTKITETEKTELFDLIANIG